MTKYPRTAYVCRYPFSGACVGYFQANDYYSSLIDVLRNLNEGEKRRMQHKVQKLVGSQRVDDVVLYVQNELQRQLLLKTVKGELSF